MEDEIFCINHPRVATLVRCSNCESPICPKCMVLTPVGQKCLSCGRMELKSPGGARRYAAGFAGLLTAAILEVAAVSLPLGILAFVAPLLVGYLTGSVVRKAAGGRFGAGSTAAVATGCGMAMGLLFVGAPLRLLFGFGFLFQAAIAAYVAWYRANH
ncbi:MAG: hypothetical protein WD627_00875 [Actinomycetota bacterium]